MVPAQTDEELLLNLEDIRVALLGTAWFASTR